jgi:uncharacterized protein
MDSSLSDQTIDSALGFALTRKGSKLAFSQPCSCFDGRSCQIYAQRPNRCRTFECGLLRRVNQDELDSSAALEVIARTRAQVDKIREQMKQLGNADQDLPLSRRYARLMAEPIDLAGAEELVELRAELMLGVEELMRSLHRDFLT